MSANATAEIGANLRAARRAAGLSQQALAERAVCSVSMVRLVESGYEPDGSLVLPRIRLALRHYLTNDEGPAANGPLATTSAAGIGDDRATG